MSNLSQFFSGGPRVWVSGTTYSIGNVVLSPADNYQQYVRITNGAGTTDPASDTTNYRPHGGRARKSMQRGLATLATNVNNTTVTISSVATAKTRCTLLGYTGPSSTPGPNAVPLYIYLTNSTTLTIQRTSGDMGAFTISYEVEEDY